MLGSVESSRSLPYELGFSQVILEGDALQIVQAVNKKIKYLSWHDHLIEAIKSLLISNPSWTVQHIGREGNKVAQSLAKEALKQDQEKLWLEDFPAFITGPFILDRNCMD